MLVYSYPIDDPDLTISAVAEYVREEHARMAARVLAPASEDDLIDCVTTMSEHNGVLSGGLAFLGRSHIYWWAIWGDDQKRIADDLDAVRQSLREQATRR